MDPSKLVLTALRFNERINQQDLEGLAELMTDDHAFIDSRGNITEAKML
jgi:ketosteroid isomerase-like protein